MEAWRGLGRQVGDRGGGWDCVMGREEGGQGAWTPTRGEGLVTLFPKVREAGMHQAKLNV